MSRKADIVAHALAHGTGAACDAFGCSDSYVRRLVREHRSAATTGPEQAASPHVGPHTAPQRQASWGARVDDCAPVSDRAKGPGWVGRPPWGWGPKPADWPDDPEPEPELTRVDGAQPEVPEPEPTPQGAPPNHDIIKYAGDPPAPPQPPHVAHSTAMWPRPQPLHPYDPYGRPWGAWLGLAIGIALILFLILSR